MPEYDATIEYRDVPGFPDYRLGTDGSAWSCRGKQYKSLGQYPVWKQLAVIAVMREGRLVAYPRFNIYRDNKRHQGHLHTLMLETFVGPRPKGMQCCHRDGNPLNGALSNLRWGTPKSNAADKVTHGTVLVGERHFAAILTEEMVVAARRMKRSGKTHAEIAAHFGVDHGTMKGAINGANWGHLAEPPVKCDTRGNVIPGRFLRKQAGVPVHLAAG